MFYLLYAFPFLIVLVLAVLCICVLRAWETLCFMGQRGYEAVVLKIPLFAWSVYLIIPLECGSAE